MPIFEYQCDVCGTITEYLSLSSRDCPETIVCSCEFGDGVLIMSSPAISKLAGTPPRGWAPLRKSNPKSYVCDPLGNV